MQLVSTEFIVYVDGLMYARVDCDWFKVDGEMYAAVDKSLSVELESQFQDVIGE